MRVDLQWHTGGRSGADGESQDVEGDVGVRVMSPKPSQQAGCLRGVDWARGVNAL